MSKEKAQSKQKIAKKRTTKTKSVTKTAVKTAVTTKKARKVSKKKKEPNFTASESIGGKNKVVTESAKPSKALGFRNRLSLAVLSPYRFPLDIDKLATQSARVAGFAFVLIGAFFTFQNIQPVVDEIVAQTSYVPMEANLSADSGDGGGMFVVTETVSTVIVDERPVKINFQEYDNAYNLIFDVPALFVVAYVKPLSTGVERELGRAEENPHDFTKFSHNWDTTNVQDGEYAIFAKVTNETGTYDSASKKLTVKHDVVTADSSGSGDGATASSVANTTDASIAETVTTDTATDTTTTTQTDTTTAETGATNSGSTDALDAGGGALYTVVDETSDSDSDTQRIIPMVHISNASELKGDEDVVVNIEGATKVEIFLEPKSGLTQTQQSLGTANLVDSDTWKFRWNTVDTPDGSYRLYAVANLAQGQVTSDYKSISVKNPIKSEDESTGGSAEAVDSDTQETYSKNTQEAQEEIQKIAEEQADYIYAPAVPSDEPVTMVASADFEDAQAVKDKTDELLKEYKIDIDNELGRLASAIRSGDEDQIKRVKERIQKLRKTIIRNSFTTGTDEFIVFVDKKLNEELGSLIQKITQIESIIRTRVGDAVSIDTDNDGITDFDEITIYKTDPTTADSDNDGFTDGAEILSGYDPLDAESEVLVEYESPRERGVVRDDLLTISEIITITPASDVALPEGVQVEAKITGTALPNSFVRLYIFSTPTMVTVRTDSTGAWSYAFDKELSDGEHEIYVGITDNAGKLLAKSSPLAFVKTADAFAEIAQADDGSVIAAQIAPKRNLLSDNVILLVMSISIIVIGLILLLLGLFLGSRASEHASFAGYMTNPAS